MEELIVVRHGTYDDETGGLMAFGRRQFAKLSGPIVAAVAGRSVAVVSSDATRAVESAEILAAALGGVEVLAFEQFFSNGGASIGAERIETGLELLRAQGAEVVVLVTHYEWTRDLPAHLLRGVGYLEQPEFVRRGHALENGCAILLPLSGERHSWRLLP